MTCNIFFEYVQNAIFLLMIAAVILGADWVMIVHINDKLFQLFDSSIALISIIVHLLYTKYIRLTYSHQLGFFL